MKILVVVILLSLPVSVDAQGWISPQVNFGTVRLNWQDAVELKTSKPELEVGFGYRSRQPFTLQFAYSGTRNLSTTAYPDSLESPISVNGQTFGKKSGQAKGQAQAGAGSQETVVVDTNCSMADVRVTVPQFRSSFAPVGRLAFLNLSITAYGKIDGKQAEVSESITRYYPQIGLAYNHRQGAALVTLLGTVGQRSSHIEANLNWNIRPDVWIGVGGKRDYVGFDNGRIEIAAFSVKAGVVF